MFWWLYGCGLKGLCCGLFFIHVGSQKLGDGANSDQWPIFMPLVGRLSEGKAKWGGLLDWVVTLWHQLHVNERICPSFSSASSPSSLLCIVLFRTNRSHGCPQFPLRGYRFCCPLLQILLRIPQFKQCLLINTGVPEFPSLVKSSIKKHWSFSVSYGKIVY